jgi:DNA-binding NarL/FixJ family response regulator
VSVPASLADDPTPKGGGGGVRDHRIEELTPRELEVLKLIARGLSNAEIAVELAVSSTTVKTHVGRVLMKLGVRDRAHAIICAYESGLVTPGQAS